MYRRVDPSDGIKRVIGSHEQRVWRNHLKMVVCRWMIMPDKPEIRISVAGRHTFSIK
jgi:hypothetical protein